MKLSTFVIIFFAISTASLAQSSTESNSQYSDCDKIASQIGRMQQQLYNLEQRENYCKSQTPVDQEQVDLILERKAKVNQQLEKHTLIQAENCNPNNDLEEAETESNDNDSQPTRPKTMKEPSNAGQEYQRIEVSEPQ